MKRLSPAILVAIAVILVTPAASATKTVDITAAGFTPNRLTIEFGDTVTWTNKDTANHQVLADQGAFPTSPVLGPNQSYSHTFTRSGNFSYRDPLNRNRRGTIIVRTGVSISATATPVVYGQSKTLSGLVSSRASGETVTIEAMECGKTTFSRVASATSGANGAWSYAAKPSLNTTYEARWRSATSARVATKVAPAVRLRRVRLGRFSASVTAAQSFVGKYVVLQRFARTSRSWKTVKRVVLRTAKAGVAPTMTTSVGFRSRVARGTRLRLLLIQSQAGTCYVPGRSAAIRA
jgi:plastocyanin